MFFILDFWILDSNFWIYHRFSDLLKKNYGYRNPYINFDISCYMDLSKLLHGCWRCLSCYVDLSKLFHVFLALCQTNLAEYFITGCSFCSLCHMGSFNPWCDVSGRFFLKTSDVSLIYKCRIVFKIFKSAWKYIITLLISQPYAPQETNIYKAGMLLCTRRVCIL